MGRAAAVLRTQPCLVLSTIDADGPWAAMLAFAPRKPRALYFLSRMWARHSRAVAADPRVAGVVYSAPDVSGLGESVQFEGTVTVVRMNSDEGHEGWRLLAPRTGVDLASQPEPAVDQQLYRIDVAAAFVLDKEAWATRGVDARQEVAVEEVFGQASPSW